MEGVRLEKCNISALENEFLGPSGVLRIRPFVDWAKYNYQEHINFLHAYAIYCLPTRELVDFISANIINPAIEIGAGHGALALELGIPATDSKMQSRPEVQAYYSALGQVPINYPGFVEELDAEEAIERYKPRTVVGTFITHKYNGIDGNALGVEEENILQNVERYILVGNLDTHRTKPILRRSHADYYFPEIVTRSVNQKNNRVFIWNKI